MNYSLQSINLHGLVKSTINCDIRNNFEVELCIWVEALDRISFLLRADSRGNIMALLKKDFEHMSGNEASATWILLISVS